MFHRLTLPSLLTTTTRKIRRPITLFPSFYYYLTVSASSHAVCNCFSSVTMLSPPYHYRSNGNGVPALDLSELETKINDRETKRQSAFDISRKIHVQCVRTKANMEVPESSTDKTFMELAELSKSLHDAIGSSDEGFDDHRTPREANLSHRVEEFVRLLAFNHFLASGTLIAPSECEGFVTDEEYLAGACMGLCQDVSRYAIGRATARDVPSVQTSRDLIQEILDYLMQFEFRNGPLRRKYDGTKYALKSVETLLYELSVTGSSTTTTTANTNIEDEEPQVKRTKISSTLSAPDQLEDIRQRMEHRDELREQLIKKCRDGQKAAKQAIYALHRNDVTKAQRLLQQCQDCITNDLFPIVQQEPPLRSGSCSNVLEEYAEAQLFYIWLLGKQEKDRVTGKGVLLQPNDFAIELEPEEYLGGLCDLTGEIGRYAVQRGTARDFAGVQQCLEANTAILLALQLLERFPSSGNNIGKKMDQLRRSVEKLERMTYELSLSEATGRNMASEAVGPPPMVGGEESTDITRDE